MINRYKTIFPLPKEATVTQVRNCIHHGGDQQGVLRLKVASQGTAHHLTWLLDPFYGKYSHCKGQGPEGSKRF